MEGFRYTPRLKSGQGALQTSCLEGYRAETAETQLLERAEAKSQFGDL